MKIDNPPVRRSRVVQFTRDMTAASGAVAYTGFGFRPSTLLILSNAYSNISSIGIVGNDLAEMCLTREDSPIVWAIRLQIISLVVGAGVLQQAVMASFDADGFTLTWTKAGAPGAGTADFVVLGFE